MNKNGFYLLTAVLLAGAAHAQKADLKADEVVVTATRFEDTYADKPLNMTVITSEDIRHSPARTLPQLLSYQAGVGGRDLFGNNAAVAPKPRMSIVACEALFPNKSRPPTPA